MSKELVTILCWKRGHSNDLALTRKQEEKVQRQAESMKAVCPTCRDEHDENNPIIIYRGQTIFNPCKAFKCPHGHITTVSLFKNNMLHVKYGNESDQFENIVGSIQDIQDYLDNRDIACNHNGCGEHLEPIDDFDLSYPNTPGIKTIRRLGDIWDKEGLEPVRNGHYDGDGHYHTTNSEVANKERLRNLKKQRNVDLDRLNVTSINETTERRSGHIKNKSDINK